MKTENCYSIKSTFNFFLVIFLIDSVIEVDGRRRKEKFFIMFGERKSGREGKKAAVA